MAAGAGHLQDRERGGESARRRLAAELVQATDSTSPRQSGAAFRRPDLAEYDGYEGALLAAAGARSTRGGGGLQLYPGAAKNQLRSVTAGHPQQAGEDAAEDAWFK